MELSSPISSSPSRYSQKEFRDGIVKLEDMMEKDIPSTKSEHNLKHHFLEKQYLREIFNPAGELIVTKIHKVEHPFFLMAGEMSIMTENGEEHIVAPYYGITPVGTKRIIYTHTDCLFITVHPTELKDPDEIEKEVIASDYKELEDE